MIVGAAVALLDERGERGLTFRLLATRLRTGPGALYWHVANKDELVTLAADEVLGYAFAGGPHLAGLEGEDGLRALAVAVYDVLDRHPWAAPHVTAPAALPNALRLLDTIGTLVARTGLPTERQFAVATAISFYITGVSAQLIVPVAAVGATSREAFLARTAERWGALDPATHPFLTRTTADLRDHDDRDQFTAGLDLILDGLAAAADHRPRA